MEDTYLKVAGYFVSVARGKALKVQNSAKIINYRLAFFAPALTNNI